MPQGDICSGLFCHDSSFTRIVSAFLKTFALSLVNRVALTIVSLHLQLSARICGFLPKSALLKCLIFQEKERICKICIWAGFVPLGLSPLKVPCLKGYSLIAASKRTRKLLPTKVGCRQYAVERAPEAMRGTRGHFNCTFFGCIWEHIRF